MANDNLAGRSVNNALKGGLRYPHKTGVRLVVVTVSNFDGPAREGTGVAAKFPDMATHCAARSTGPDPRKLKAGGR